MLATLRKWLIIILLIAAAGFLLYEWVQFQQTRDLLPAGTVVANIEVGGMTIEQAGEKLTESYLSPVYLYHLDEHIELDPSAVGFKLDTERMLGQLEQKLASREAWLQFANYIAKRPLQPVIIPLSATHDRAGLQAMLQSVADFLDQPAEALQILAEGESLEESGTGYVTNLEASLPLAEEALYRLDHRVANLVVDAQEPPELSLELLSDSIEAKLQRFDGLGSIFIIDLQTGEEIGINADVAMSGLSILKIGIFVEAYRALDNSPDDYQQQLFLDTATRSSNYGANLLLHLVAGENNTYLGADMFTESMRRLGLINTYMAVPYDASPPAYRQTTYVTPANSRPDLPTQPDATMQSTAEEIGSLLAMIYYCSKGGGALLAVYPDEITPEECQSIIDLMVLNEEGNLIRFGVPDGIPVSHKHGWARATHADAGIVFSPGGDFVIVEYLDQPGDWLLADVSFPILRDIARATYNYFNMDNPYLVDVLSERAVFDPLDPFSEGRQENNDAADENIQGETAEEGGFPNGNDGLSADE